MGRGWLRCACARIPTQTSSSSKAFTQWCVFTDSLINILIIIINILSNNNFSNNLEYDDYEPGDDPSPQRPMGYPDTMTPGISVNSEESPGREPNEADARELETLHDGEACFLL